VAEPLTNSPKEEQNMKIEIKFEESKKGNRIKSGEDFISHHDGRTFTLADIFRLAKEYIDLKAKESSSDPQN
jgi:hypothetical protein